MNILVAVALVLVGVVAGLQAWRWSDSRRAAQVWADLERLGQIPPSTFDPSSVEDLPEPARRYFLYTIKAGTPIRHVTEILMSGEIGLGTQDKPNYWPMQAKQILAPPHGLVWASDESPYVGQELRSIKSLSEREIQSLRRGDGLGFAKLAELNHFPGPRHVLDLSAPCTASTSDVS